MPAHPTDKTNPAIDPAFVAEVVRRVVARLNHREPAETPGEAPGEAERAAAVAERVISAATIRRFAGKTKQLKIDPRAVVTPAARDEAKHHGISLVRSLAGAVSLPEETAGQAGRAAAPAQRRPSDPPQPITDTDQPERADSIASQLARRGVTGNARIVLSDRPAEEVHRQAAAGQRAAMIRCVGDVDRFGAELRPQIWVLDMVDLNWIAAVNVAARILHNGGSVR